MTPKRRMYAALEGGDAALPPVAGSYLFLSDADHWEQLTGLPVWKFYEWQNLPPEEHVEQYATFREKLPFDLFQPWPAAPREEREAVEIVHRPAGHYILDRRTGSSKKVPESIHEAGSDGPANERRAVFSVRDAREQVKVTKAEELLRRGSLDYSIEALKRFGDDYFFMTGGIVNTFFACSVYVGLTNLFALLLEEPDLIISLSDRILEQNIEIIRALAEAGGDGIYIDDATATCDMISVKHYERFSLPYMREEVKEIQRLGKKAFLVYFGGIADRVEQILSLGADGLMMETSMKGYVNDIAVIAEQVADRTCLFGNLDPFGDIELASEDALLAKLKLQYTAGTRFGRFITSTGSPLTPRTPVSRIRWYIDRAHELGTGIS